MHTALTFLYFVEVAVILTIPEPLAVTTPFFETTATFVLLLFHLTFFEALDGLTFLIFNFTLSPTSSWRLFLFKVIFFTLTVFAVTVVKPLGSVANNTTANKIATNFLIFIFSTFLSSCFSLVYFYLTIINSYIYCFKIVVNSIIFFALYSYGIRF